MNVGVSKASDAPEEPVVSNEDSATIDVSMKVNIGRAAVNGVKTSEMSEFFVTRLADMMAVMGMKSVTASRYSSGLGCRIISSMVPFDGVPNSVVQKGVIAKDAIGLLMSVANLTRIELRVDGDEYDRLRSAWSLDRNEDAVRNHKTSDSKDDVEGNIKIVDPSESK